MNWLVIASILLDCVALGILAGLVVNKIKNSKKD